MGRRGCRTLPEPGDAQHESGRAAATCRWFAGHKYRVKPDEIVVSTSPSNVTGWRRAHEACAFGDRAALPVRVALSPRDGCDAVLGGRRPGIWPRRGSRPCRARRRALGVAAWRRVRRCRHRAAASTRAGRDRAPVRVRVRVPWRTGCARCTQQRCPSETGQHCSIRFDQTGSAVGDDQHWRRASAGDQVVARAPVSPRRTRASRASPTTARARRLR
jgi:hypothetical protein